MSDPAILEQSEKAPLNLGANGDLHIVGQVIYEIIGCDTAVLSTSLSDLGQEVGALSSSNSAFIVISSDLIFSDL